MSVIARIGNNDKAFLRLKIKIAVISFLAVTLFLIVNVLLLPAFIFN